MQDTLVQQKINRQTDRTAFSCSKAVQFISLCVFALSFALLPKELFANPASTPLPSHKPLDVLVERGIIGEAPIPGNKPIGKGLWLSQKDRQLYRDIFALQEEGAWKEADKKIAQLSDYRLRGVYLYQRYMHATEWVSKYEELYGWLMLYADHAGADEIYSLANKRHKAGLPFPPRNQEERLIKGMITELNPSAPAYYTRKRRSAVQQREVNRLTRNTRRDLRNTAPTRAYRRLRDDRSAAYLDDIEYDRLRAKIAASYLFVGKLELAKELSEASLARSGQKAPRAGWVAGLTSWRLGDFPSSYRFFQSTALSEHASTWTRAAAAYWASRAAMKAGYFREVSYWLNIAADYDRTFYGLLANEALQREIKFHWYVPKFNLRHKELLAQYPQARRAMLLEQAGQPHLASRELLRLHPEQNKPLREAMIAYALNAELPGFALRFAYIFRPYDGVFYDAALYPLGSWEPRGGYKIDEALMHAIILQESKFDHRAENPTSKAMGLMQILPSTANWVTGTKDYSYRGRHALKDPVTNLSVGQRYLQKLLRMSEVDRNPYFLAMAYNAGPGNLRRWKRELSDIDDILLFVEMIPFAETRAYVERVMSNYWIYRKRMGRDVPSLKATVSGDRPLLAHAASR